MAEVYHPNAVTQRQKQTRSQRSSSTGETERQPQQDGIVTKAIRTTNYRKMRFRLAQEADAATANGRYRNGL